MSSPVPHIHPSTDRGPRLFLSDLHLESEDGAALRRLQELLGYWAPRCDAIFLLGDLTELWIGDDDDAPVARAFSDVLRESARATSVYLMPGNRDFLYGDELAQRTGVQLIPDPVLLDDTVLLAHGDAYCVDDAPYQQFRTLVRSAEWQADILSKSLDERRAIGEAMRAQSRDTNANKAAHIMDVNDDAVAQALDESGVKTLLHGHTHRPGRHHDGDRLRCVLGAWERCGYYALLNAGRLRLHCFSLAVPYVGPDAGTPL